jgi:hypothetical protein
VQYQLHPISTQIAVVKGTPRLVAFCISNQLYFKAADKVVILSEALRRSIANRELYGAKSKDPGDAYWQMLLGAFRPQTTPEDEKVTNSGEAEVGGPAIFSPTPILSSVMFSLRHSTSGRSLDQTAGGKIGQSSCLPAQWEERPPAIPGRMRTGRRL